MNSHFLLAIVGAVFGWAATGTLIPFYQSAEAQVFQETPDWEAWRNSRRSVVVELFTSQGCSSCPPADALLRELASEAKQRGVSLYPLSFHVDYWNYLGWRDPYSGTDATQRQYQYQTTFKSRNVYTPQAVLNGSSELVGSKRRAMYQGLNREFANGQDLVKFAAVHQKDDGKKVRLSFQQPEKSAVLRIAYITERRENAVASGENSGETLSHTNVVEQLDSYPIPASAQGRRSPTTSDSNEVGYLQVDLRRVPTQDRPILAFIQEQESMKILAALPLGISKGPQSGLQ